MIKIKTEILKSMVERAIKVCSFEKMLPLSELFEITVDGETLTIRSTDNVNHLYLKAKIEGNSESLKVVVDANIFNALVSKLTTEEVELELTENALVVTGNGVYYLDLRIDEQGKIISFPEIAYDESKADKDISFPNLSNKMAVCRSAIPELVDEKNLLYYYLTDMIMSTDAHKLSAVKNEDSLKDSKIFIPKAIGKVLTEISLEDGKYYVENDRLYIIAPSYVFVIRIGGDACEDFPAEAIETRINSTKPYTAKVNKNNILSMLDRISIFVDKYDETAVDITFSKEGMKLDSKKKNGSELVKYIEANIEGLVERTDTLSITSLKDILEVLPSDEIIVEFGPDEDGNQTIRFKDGEIIQVICPLDLDN